MYISEEFISYFVNYSGNKYIFSLIHLILKNNNNKYILRVINRTLSLLKTTPSRFTPCRDATLSTLADHPSTTADEATDKVETPLGSGYGSQEENADFVTFSCCTQ